MKVKVLTAALVVSVGINIGTVVTLSYHWWHEREDAQDSHLWRSTGPNHLRDELDLSDQQMDRVRAAREKALAELRPLRIELITKRRDLVDLLKELEPHQGRMDTIILEIAGLQAELESQIVKDIQQIKRLLTKEQQEMFFKPFERALIERALQPPPQEQESSPKPARQVPGDE
jgi:Spy/CpxP family protein refolding chaperone